MPRRGRPSPPRTRRFCCSAWTFGTHGKVTFQTALPVLTEPSGPVSVHYENGQTRQWVLARYDHEPGDDDPAAEPEEAPGTAPRGKS